MRACSKCGELYNTERCNPCRARDKASQRTLQPERHILASMVQRCHNKRNPGYRYYGARGIQVADEWRGPEGFDRFLDHIGPRPTVGHSVDRIDTLRGYEPGNVRWATDLEQNRNARSNVKLTIDGVTLCISEWAERVGIGNKIIEHRLRLGWTQEDAVKRPVRVQRRPRCSQ